MFDLLISHLPMGTHNLLLKSGSTLDPRRVIPCSPIKLLEFSFQPMRRRYVDSFCCSMKKTVDIAKSSRRCDGSILFLQSNITA